MRYSSYESAQGNNYCNFPIKKNWNNRLSGINYDWLWSWHKIQEIKEFLSLRKMDQQNQQPIQEKIEGKPPIKTNWKFIAIVVFLAVLAGGAIWLWYEHQQQSFRKPLPVVNEDQACELDIDCVIVATKCSSCECGTPINKAHQQKYQSQLETLCKNYRGPEFDCAFDCSTLFPRCINNRCVLSAKKPTDETADWQTYRNEEFGFEVRYPSTWRGNAVEASTHSGDFCGEPYYSQVYIETYQSDECYPPFLLIGIFTNKTVEARIRELKKKHYKLLSRTSTILGNQESVRVILEPHIYAGIEITYTLLLNKGVLYEFNASGLKSNEKVLYDQILSTFRFIPTP